MIKDLQFSSQGVYQAKVDQYWTILQFDDEELLSDAICTCEEDESICSHALLLKEKIYDGYPHPLHVRFRLSLWNKLCQFMSLYDVVLENGSYITYSDTDKIIFSIQNNDEIHAFINEREKETEETSLKFSKLSQEEILLWKEGRPSFALRYELSFWSDIAKYLMESNDYVIEFCYSKKQIPNGIKVRLKGIEAYFYISEANLPEVIPTLSSVRSPLKVYSASYDTISKIHFRNGAFFIEREPQVMAPVKKPGHALQIGEWLFVPGDGFYNTAEKAWLYQNTIRTELVPEFLENHEELLERFLVGTKMHRTCHELSYNLFFDSQDNLHVDAYLEEIGDLKESVLYGSWIYLEERGFVRIEAPFLDHLQTIIPSEGVSEFVTKNRVFLSHYEGFQTHLTSVNADLSYRMKDDHSLIFSSNTDVGEGKDFKEWIYVKKEGFYAKHLGRLGVFIQPGMSIPPREIPFFIRMHQDELEVLPGFFSQTCPICSVKLDVTLNEAQNVVVTPIFESDKELLFFGDYVFVRGEGFYPIPGEMQLPERYRTRSVLVGEQIEFFLKEELPTLRPYLNTLDPRLQQHALQLTLHGLKKTENGLIAAQLEFETSEGALSALDIWHGMQAKKRYMFSSLGLIDLADSQFDWLRHIDSEKIDKEIRLSSLEFLRLIFSAKIEENLDHDQEKLWRSFCTFTTEEPIDLSLLKSTLRPYQETGLKWLWFLYTQRLSGLLCDDMGLGKTHQAMALMAAAGKGHKFLVVCPTSVIYHWQEKLKEFLPHLKIYTLYGQARNLKDFEKNYDLLLTSYGVFRIEYTALSKISFEIAIFDEVQVAKNYQSKVHKALLTLHSRMKVGLTGTPIENRLRELKSLFDIVLPTYMPSESSYRELFTIPIEKNNDIEKKGLLSRLIKPFVMRRKKGDVLLELPEKTEELAFAELLPDQRTLYEEALQQVKSSFMKEEEFSYTTLFSLLTKLKQICDHPAVFLNAPERYKEFSSGKWELFLELLTEARESEQKVVVFSHYLNMLDIMKLYLEENNIAFASVRGDTQDRGKELKRFQEDPKCLVFLGSLQAVGLGVDLTSASVVIHYDRWWNAARENQATDRVYRMGQKRGVQVFKLVTKGTLEEYIVQLIEKKGALMEEIIGFDDESVLKSLSREEWLEILFFKQNG